MLLRILEINPIVKLTLYIGVGTGGGGGGGGHRGHVPPNQLERGAEPPEPCLSMLYYAYPRAQALKGKEKESLVHAVCACA